MGISLSIRPVAQQGRQLAVRFYSRWHYARSGMGVSARRIRLAMTLFVTQKINLEDTFIYGGASVFPNPYKDSMFPNP